MDTDRKNTCQNRNATGNTIVARESGVSFFRHRRARRFWCVASCSRSTMPTLFGKTKSSLCCFHVWLFSGNQIWRACNFDPAARLFKHHVRHHRVRIASRTSAMFVERIHKKAVQAFKRFRWMLNGADQCIGHLDLVPGQATNQRLSVDCSESLFTSADWEPCELNKPNVNRFMTVANCLFLQFEC